MSGSCEDIATDLVQKALLRNITKQRTYDRDTKYFHWDSIPYPDDCIEMSRSDARWITTRSLYLFVHQRSHVRKNNSISPLLHAIGHLPFGISFNILTFM